MKILELFSGYGTASFALKRLGMPYECVGYSDIDKYANQCFRQNHSGKELGDVKQINPNDLEDFDLLTGGFPCQAFSVAGKMQGETDPRGTLFYEIIRIAEVKKPKYMLLENVKGLTSKKFKDTFNKILSELDRIGYDVYWGVLNTKDYGIPQSRARVWFVCFSRADLLESERQFKFPEKEELKIFIKDILEPVVDEKYYLSEKMQERFAKYLEEKNKVVNLQPRQGKGIGGKGIISKGDGTSYCLDQNNTQGIVCAMRGRNPDNPKSRVAGLPTEQQLEFKEDGITNTISTVQKDNLIYDQHRANEWREFENVSSTLKQTMGTGGNNVPMISNTLTTELAHSTGRDFFRSGQAERILKASGKLRRLTPKECFRLQGFFNDEVNLEGLSDTQRYKLAGNGQTVTVVEKILRNMFQVDNGK